MGEVLGATRTPNLGSFRRLSVLREAPRSAVQGLFWGGLGHATASIHVERPETGFAVSVVNAWWRLERYACPIRDIGDPTLTRPLLRLSSCDPSEADVAALIAHGAARPTEPGRIGGAVDQTAEAGSTGPALCPVISCSTSARTRRTRSGCSSSSGHLDHWRTPAAWHLRPAFGPAMDVPASRPRPELTAGPGPADAPVPATPTRPEPSGAPPSTPFPPPVTELGG